MLIYSWIFGIFFAFFASTSILGYSFAFSRAFPTRNFPLGNLFLGLGSVLTILYVGGLLGLFQEFFYTSVIVLGLFLLVIYRHQHFFIFQDFSLFKTRSNSKTFLNIEHKQELLWLVFPALYFLARFFTCGLPQQHSDPLYYHLLAPKTWVWMGKIKLVEAHPSFAQAGLFESLYAFPMFWLESISTDSLVVAQIYSQWMHMIWGQGLTVLAAFGILTKVFGLRANSRAFFIAWLCSTLAAFEWTGCLAKNDYALAAFALSGMVFWQKKNPFLAGLLFGLAFSIRVFTIWPLTAIAILLLFKRDFRFLLWLTIGVLLAAAPTLIRNFYHTLNPFFPVLSAKIGRQWISQGWNAHNSSFGGLPQFHLDMLGWIKDKMLEKALPKVILLAAVALSLIALFTKRSARTLAHKLPFSPMEWAMFLFLELLFCVLCLRSSADGRYSIFISIPLCLTACFLIQKSLSTIVSQKLQKKLSAFQYLFLLAGLLVSIPIDEVMKVPKHYLFEVSDKYVEQFHPLYRMHIWIRFEIPKERKILFLGEKIQYYLDRDFESVSEMKKWEDIFATVNSTTDLMRVAKAGGYDYLQLNSWSANLFAKSPEFQKNFWSDFLKQKKLAVFELEDSLIFPL